MRADPDQGGADPGPGGMPPPGLVGGARPGVPLFLHRETYRRRRVMDAARLLPILGAALLLLPGLWAPEHSNAAGAVYLFGCWAALILATAVLSRRLSAPLRDRPGAAAQTDPPQTDPAQADPPPDGPSREEAPR